MLYLALASFIFLLVRLVVTAVNFLQQPKLAPSSEAHNDLVSILIPARNEAANIANTIRSILDFKEINYELLILDDASTDQTAEIVKGFAARYPHIRLLEGNPLPQGWLGKNWACHQLAQQAQGRYLLFLDADVSPSPCVAKAALSEMKKNQLGLLSVFPDQLLITQGEKIVVPMMHYLLLTMLPLRLVFASRERLLAAANGQFMLFDAGLYRRYQWHEQVKSVITEDIEIAKAVKEQQIRAATFLANGMVHCRMYRSYEEAINGFSKNLLPGFGNSLSLLIGYLLLTSLGYAAMCICMPLLFALSLLLSVLTNTMLGQLSNQSLWVTVMLHPLRVVSLLVIGAKAIYRHWTGTNEWKGRRIA